MSGVFGVAARANCMDDLFYGTDYQSHLGTEFGGLAVQGDRVHRAIHRIAHGQFKSLFDEFYHSVSGQTGIGVISDSDPQPITVRSRFGAFTLVTAGLVTNRDALARELIDEGATFNEVSDGRVNQTELVAKVIAQKDAPVAGIEAAFDRVAGSLSLLMMTEGGVYAAGDPHARLPLAIGRREGAVAAASESCAFPNLGFELVRSLRPGEIVCFNADGLKTADGPVGQRKTCTFLWIYTGYPASAYDGVAVECVRERCGAVLARKDCVEADLAAGVPDSGTGHAIGYAMESGLPFRRPLVKIHSAGYGRSYTPPSQDVRDRIAHMKLVAIDEVIRGNRLIVCEDSIVRGTQLKNLTLKKLWDAGAKEVHIRVACPPLMFPCIYALSTRTEKELAARRAIHDMEGAEVEDVGEYLDPTSEKHAAMVEWVRKDVGCTSLSYLTLDEVFEAVGKPACELCTYCWNGCTG